MSRVGLSLGGCCALARAAPPPATPRRRLPPDRSPARRFSTVARIGHVHSSRCLLDVCLFPRPHLASRVVEKAFVVALAQLPARLGRELREERGVLRVDLEIGLLRRR